MTECPRKSVFLFVGLFLFFIIRWLQCLPKKNAIYFCTFSKSGSIQPNTLIPHPWKKTSHLPFTVEKKKRKIKNHGCIHDASLVGQRELTGGLVPSLQTQAGNPGPVWTVTCSRGAWELIMEVTSRDSPSQFKERGLALSSAKEKKTCSLKKIFLKKWGKKGG